ncbi:TPA: hypothetical protein ACGORW_001890 [Streptococcus suis]
MYQDNVWKEWIANVMAVKPKSDLLDSKRGVEVTKLCIDYERQDFNWHRSDIDTFWIDIHMFVKYKLSDKEIRFILKQQPAFCQLNPLDRTSWKAEIKSPVIAWR